MVRKRNLKNSVKKSKKKLETTNKNIKKKFTKTKKNVKTSNKSIPLSLE